MKALYLLPAALLLAVNVSAGRPDGGKTPLPFRFLETAQERLAHYLPVRQLPRLLPLPRRRSVIATGCMPVGRYDVEVDNYALCITGILRQSPRKIAGRM